MSKAPTSASNVSSLKPSTAMSKAPTSSGQLKTSSAQAKVSVVKEEKKSSVVTEEKKSEERLEDYDEDDHKPLSARCKGNVGKPPTKSIVKENLEDSDEKPLRSSFQMKSGAGTSSSKYNDCDDKKPLSSLFSTQNGVTPAQRPLDKQKSEISSTKKPKTSDSSPMEKNKQVSIKPEVKEDDDDDHIPISQRIKKQVRTMERVDNSNADLGLPKDIFYDIMLSLTIWSIVMCKNVCKLWRELLSDSEFKALHFARAKPCILVRDGEQSRFGRALYMVDSGGDLDPNNSWCACKSYDNTPVLCRRSTKVKQKLKIPLRDSDTMIIRSGGDANSLFGTKGVCKRTNYRKLPPETLRDHIYSDISSCNGLLIMYCRDDKFVTSVGNPITGEFIDLPPCEREWHRRRSFTTCMSFSTIRNQYKVLQVYHIDAEVEIFTLGTSCQWKCVNLSKFKPVWYSFISFKGALHWIFFLGHEIESRSARIACFDLDEEDFRPLSLPLPPSLNSSLSSKSIGVLRDRLCLYHTANDYHGDSMDVWAMEEYGVAESWTKLFSVNAKRTTWKRPLFKPLILRNDGTLLLLDTDNTLIKCDQLGELGCKLLKCNGIRPEFDAIPHIPSFVSLKDIVDPTKVKITKVYKRCGKINLIEENYGVYLACRKA